MNGIESEPLIGTVNTHMSDNRPLFGDRSTNRVSMRSLHRFPPLIHCLIVFKDRIISLSLFSVCGLLLLIAIITLVTIKFNAINLITILVILSFVASHALLIQWYRLGDLDPKFRYLLLWNSVNICVLCIVAIVYYHFSSK
ncbi:unnamed protein product [Oppiella nova]|uniref:Uncharacterized protein n=1 Tax=Oppiella nova TaxID=334625 RepID=A0A7R9MDI7_9ACAR|nr:unnamed protein product [Oppiella nova]CAG2175362.1 unnamed protein product [Oppiella nova]